MNSGLISIYEESQLFNISAHIQDKKKKENQKLWGIWIMLALSILKVEITLLVRSTTSVSTYHPWQLNFNHKGKDPLY